MKYFLAIIASLIFSTAIFFLSPSSEIPLHFDFTGKPTAFGSKTSIFMHVAYVAFAAFAFSLAETNKKAREDQKRVLGYLYGIVMGYMIFSPLFSLYLSKILTGTYQAISPVFIMGIVVAFVVFFRKELKKN